MGVAVLMPVISQRTIAQQVNDARLNAIAIGAAEQSERLTIPAIYRPQRLQDALARWPPDRRLNVAVERSHTPLLRASYTPSGLLIGPEGGFTPTELNVIQKMSLCEASQPWTASFEKRDDVRSRAGIAPSARLWSVRWSSTRVAEETMSNPGDGDATPVTSVQQLADYFAAGCKPKERFRIGTEHEKFGFRLRDQISPPYEPADGQPGSIRDLLEGLVDHGSTAIMDADHIIGLKQGDASISLEPAGQLELSGSAVDLLHDTKQEFELHLRQIRTIAGKLGIGFMPLGFHPTATREGMPWMPKGRYKVMRRYMPLVGSRGLDMMTRTCTVQVNLDFRVGAGHGAQATCLAAVAATGDCSVCKFALRGRSPNGFDFFPSRAHIWTDTDNQRSGIPPGVPGRLRLRAICGMACRFGPDVLRLP